MRTGVLVKHEIEVFWRPRTRRGFANRPSPTSNYWIGIFLVIALECVLACSPVTNQAASLTVGFEVLVLELDHLEIAVSVALLERAG